MGSLPEKTDLPNSIPRAILVGGRVEHKSFNKIQGISLEIEEAGIFPNFHGICSHLPSVDGEEFVVVGHFTVRKSVQTRNGNPPLWFFVI